MATSREVTEYRFYWATNVSGSIEAHFSMAITVLDPDEGTKGTRKFTLIRDDLPPGMQITWDDFLTDMLQFTNTKNGKTVTYPTGSV